MKTLRRVTAVMSSSMHKLQLVEVMAYAQQVRNIDEPAIECSLRDVELRARDLMRREGHDEADHHMVGVLAAIQHGLAPGRIVWAKEVALVTTEEWE